MLVALAGPVINFVICICTYLFFNKNQLNIEIIYANLIIGIFNLLPIYPLDGGRIIKCIFKLKRGNEIACKYTNIISNIFIILLTMLSSIGIYYYKNISILFIIVYLWVLVIIENKKYNLKKRIYKMIENS